MIRNDGNLDSALGDLRLGNHVAEAPPLPDFFAKELSALQPVAPRRPTRDFGRVAAISLVYGAALIAILALRRDLGGLPLSWVLAYATAWFGSFAALTHLAIVPRRGSVMPRSRLAGAAAALVALLFIVGGLLMEPAGAAGTVKYTLATVYRGYPCLEIGLGTAIVPIVFGALALRGALPVGSRWTAAGLGAAGGSLGGLVLHLHCPISDGWHLGIIHGGVVVLAALVAALLVPPLSESR